MDDISYFTITPWGYLPCLYKCSPTNYLTAHSIVYHAYIQIDYFIQLCSTQQQSYGLLAKCIAKYYMVVHYTNLDVMTLAP